MASIASVFVEVLPETAKVAAGIEKALRGVDARKIGRELGRELEQGIGDTRSAAFRTIARTLWLNCSASTLMPSTYRELERHREERLCYLPIRASS